MKTYVHAISSMDSTLFSNMKILVQHLDKYENIITNIINHMNPGWEDKPKIANLQAHNVDQLFLVKWSVDYREGGRGGDKKWSFNNSE